MTITLYQFPISHYCEKARWALDYKGVPYRIKNLLPGQHIKFVRSVAPKSHVPVLEADGEYVQQSAGIISWLDQHYPNKPLTPEDPELREQALAWERFADEELGDHVRRWAYFTLLEHPKVVLPALTAGAPLLAKPLFRILFPKVRELMKRVMKIYPEPAQHSATMLDSGLAKLEEQLQGRKFLVGDQFSRADLAVSAMLAPFLMPPQYGVKWPARAPEPLQSWVDARADKLVWAEKIYQQYRDA